jgi:hypothetical protein
MYTINVITNDDWANSLALNKSVFINEIYFKPFKKKLRLHEPSYVLHNQPSVSGLTFIITINL